MARHHIFGARYKNLIRILAEARKERGVNQTDLATALGVDQSHVSKIERRERRLDVIEYFEYCKAIGADPCEIYTRSGDPV